MDATPPAADRRRSSRGPLPAAASAPDAAPLKALAGVLLLVPLLVLPVLVLLYAGPSVLEEHSRLERYRPVDAVVVSTAVERRPGAGHLSAASYVPRVVFRYVVGEHAYTAGKVTPLDVGGTERWARRRIAGYPPGSRVTAYYDPRQPASAFLDRRGMPALTATFFLPAPLLALALVLAAGARSRRRAAGRLQA